MTVASIFASPVDTAVFGSYKARRPSPKNGVERPLYPFQGRITDPGSAPFGAEPGRYHLYLSYGCPWAHIAAVVRVAKKLDDVVTASYVDEDRDGRGWAFRERFGPDPVNGFALLRDAYEATEPGYDGHISVPTLWDRTTAQVASNDFPVIPVDLATRFDAWGDASLDLYPTGLRPAIDAFDARITAAARTGGLDDDGSNVLDALDLRLGTDAFVHGDSPTLSDVRLWVKLIRFELNFAAAIERDGKALPDYPNLWSYTRRLHERHEFSATTHIEALYEQRARLLAGRPQGPLHEAAARRDEAWAKG